METPIIAAIIIASATLIVGGGGIAFKHYHIRKQQRTKLKDDFTSAGKKLVAAFEPTKQRIINRRRYFNELMTFLHQEFPKQREATHEFRRHLNPNEVEAFDKAWNQYHGNDEKNPNFIQYKDHVPGGLLSRIDEILKFIKST